MKEIYYIMKYITSIDNLAESVEDFEGDLKIFKDDLDEDRINEILSKDNAVKKILYGFLKRCTNAINNRSFIKKMLRERQLRIQQKKAKIIRRKMIRRMVVQERWRIQRLKNLEELKKEKERERSDSTSSSDNWIFIILKRIVGGCGMPKSERSRRGTLIINNKDNLCLPRSIVVKLSELETNKLDVARLKAVRDARYELQKTLTL
ncbi:uncharacterized protein LOC122856351 [Aphidius gifuensis]|uniref:uncharacterized protein LOC122856351 n=1 Tax=Aphidius gifuensis TaxID=684658 RepID=UPI001CDBA84A|nr:uncharacterized protein LOC122856351 [Aphidius gifuensis]